MLNQTYQCLSRILSLIDGNLYRLNDITTINGRGLDGNRRITDHVPFLRLGIVYPVFLSYHLANRIADLDHYRVLSVFLLGEVQGIASLCTVIPVVRNACPIQLHRRGDLISLGIPGNHIKRLSAGAKLQAVLQSSLNRRFSIDCDLTGSFHLSDLSCHAGTAWGNGRHRPIFRNLDNCLVTGTPGQRFSITWILRDSGGCQLLCLFYTKRQRRLTQLNLCQNGTVLLNIGRYNFTAVARAIIHHEIHCTSL